MNPFPNMFWNWIRYSLLMIGGIASIFFYLRLFQGRRNWLFWAAISALCLLPIVDAFSVDGALSHFLIAILTAVSSAWLIATIWRDAGRHCDNRKSEGKESVGRNGFVRQSLWSVENSLSVVD
jgi:hypothetical protein